MTGTRLLNTAQGFQLQKIHMSLKNKFVAFCILPVTFFMSAVCMAEDPAKSAFVMDPVVVSASRIPARSGRLPGNATILTREDIQSMNPTGIYDLLRRVPGLHVDRPGGRGGLGSVYVRGADPNFTLVFIDGIRVNDPTNTRGGSFNFSTLNPQEIERIEIVRGPRSSLYGSDALGGVVNIVTRNPEQSMNIFSEIRAGHKDFYDAMAGLNGPFSENADFSLNFQYTQDDGIVEGSKYAGRIANAKFFAYPSMDSAFKAVARYNEYDSESFPDDSGGPEYAVIRDVEKSEGRQAHVGFNYEKDAASRVSLKTRIGFFSQKDLTRSPGVAPGVRDPYGIPASDFDTDFHRLDFEISGLFFLPDSSKLLIGGAAQNEKGDSDGVLYMSGFAMDSDFQLERSAFSLFMEYHHYWDMGLSVLGGIRTDFPEDFRDEFSPSLGAVYRWKKTDTTFRVDWGKGFKLPSFFSLGNPLVGNPDLKPEKSDSFEAGLVQDLFGGRAFAGLTWFHTSYEDLIDLEEGPPPRLVNRSETTARGTEATLSMRVANNLKIHAHATYVKTDLKDSDEKLRNRPEWRGGAGLNFKPGENWNMIIEYLHVGKSQDSSIPTGDMVLEPYDRIDAGIVWSMSEVFQAGIMIDNVFDADYEEAVGFPSPGFRPWVFARGKF
jgi:vitamin B12 transporter